MGCGVIRPLANDGGHVAVPDGETPEIAWPRLIALARRNGLELSEADARDLQPYFAQHQRWLAELRRVVGEDEEPATVFRVAGAGDARA
jgi:hypothetical protein